jgi:hypothetical protein
MLGNTQAVIRVFYCYTPADKHLLANLEKQLAPLKHINAIAGWSDQEVLAGTHRDRMVQSYLNYSDLILLLISPDFLSVDFCYSMEMEHALDRHARGEAVIVPIILRPVMWGITDIRYLQALPQNKKPVTTWGNRDAAFYDVAVGITKVVKKLVEKQHKRFVEEYIADAESEARISNSSWIPTDPFRADQRADAEELYKNIYDKLKSVQMEIIQQGLGLQPYIDSMDQDETGPEEEEAPHIPTMKRSMPIIEGLPPQSQLQLQDAQTESPELLYFWALGDLHFYAQHEWQVHHIPRMSRMFRDLRQLWEGEGRPAFCVSPGDIVEMAGPEHYQLACQELRRQLDPVPFYPGLGNHEFFTHSGESMEELLEYFSTFWLQAPRYYWTYGGVLCVMLDVVGYPQPILTRDALFFLEIALAKHPQHIAIIFAHCPLYHTVLARGPDPALDYNSLEPFFAVENSAEVRAILARHANACLYISGHTHTGWHAPSLVITENLGGHPVTHLNLSSPWYTGRHNGPKWQGDKQCFYYRADQPDCVASLAVRVSHEQIHLRLRDHGAGGWLAEWTVPVK